MVHVDVVIVGAGAAGLSAALRATELGLETVVFEAASRPGGRAYTRYEPFGFAWDAGCHWLHSASENLLREAADREGFSYTKTRGPGYTWFDGALLSPEAEVNVDNDVEAAYRAMFAAGRAGQDVPASTVVKLAGAAEATFRWAINAEWGADPSAVSTLDASRYRDLEENWPVIDGYGALVLQLAQSVLPLVQLSTPVTRIKEVLGGYQVTTTQGEIEADAVIITASTSALAAGLIDFNPVLPAWKLEALHAVPLGYANKIALQLREDALADIPEHSVGVPVGGGDMINLRFRPYGRNLVDGYIGGPLCSEVELAGEAAMVSLGTEAMTTILGSQARDAIIATAVSRWQSERYIRGGYGAALPGLADKRADLGRPVGERLFFAGEATSPEYFSTCHGAWLTGASAAEQAASVVGIAAR
ncbi:MAG: NAD(P)/FAD-dependent oxidoreductase [Thermomicrobiales bacterium]